MHTESVSYLNQANHVVGLSIESTSNTKRLFCTEEAWPILHAKFKYELRFTKFFDTQKELRDYAEDTLKILV